jgi:hypothetical protein
VHVDLRRRHRPEPIEIGTGQGVLSAIPAGRQLQAADGDQLTLVCNRRVAVATGPLVRAYPLAGSTILYPTYVLLALLGFGYARRRSRSPMTDRSPVLPGDNADRSALTRFTADVALGVVSTTTGLAALLLGIVGLLALAQGSFAGGLIILTPAGLLGIVALLVSRRRCRGAE